MGTMLYFQPIQTVQGGKPSLCSALPTILKFLIISPVVTEVDIFLHSFTQNRTCSGLYVWIALNEA